MTADALKKSRRAKISRRATTRSSASPVLPDRRRIDTRVGGRRRPRIASRRRRRSRDEISISSRKADPRTASRKRPRRPTRSSRTTARSRRACPPAAALNDTDGKRRDHQGSAGAVRRAHGRRPTSRGRAACHRHLRPPADVAIAKRRSWRSCSRRRRAPRRRGRAGPGAAVGAVSEGVAGALGRGGEFRQGAFIGGDGARIRDRPRARVSPCVVTISANPRCVDAAARAVADRRARRRTAAYSRRDPR